MNYRRITELLGAAGAAVGAVAVGTEIAQAQDDLGANIANTVTNAVSSVATNSSSGGTLIGGVSTESNSVDLGEQTGTAASSVVACCLAASRYLTGRTRRATSVWVVAGYAFVAA